MSADYIIFAGTANPSLAETVAEQLETHVGEREIERFRRMESRALPKDIDYASIAGIRKEARQKLDAIRPASVGQASRVSGVSPADIAVLLVYLERYHKQQA